jgi:hypothetical protein
VEPPHLHLQVRLAVSCCAVLCCAVLCCAVLCCAVLCCAVLCCATSIRTACSCQGVAVEWFVCLRRPSPSAVMWVRVYSDGCVPDVCLEFCKRNGASIMRCGLRYNLLLHLLNLWDNALVDTETICACVALVEAAK